MDFAQFFMPREIENSPSSDRGKHKLADYKGQALLYASACFSLTIILSFRLAGATKVGHFALLENSTGEENSRIAWTGDLIFCLKPFSKVTVGEMGGGAVRGCSEESTSTVRHGPRVSTASTLPAPELAGTGAESEHVPAQHCTGEHRGSSPAAAT